MKIEGDEFGDWLRIDGEEFGPSDDGEFEVLASRLRVARLSDVPPGFSIRLCDRVFGSKELTGRYPNCTFEHSRDRRLLAHGETVFVVENEDVVPEERQLLLRDSLLSAKRSLEPLVADGTVVHLEEKVFDDIAYLNYSVILHDQPILDAELFIEALDIRIQGGFDRPLVFICHASEDKPFVDRLVIELDRRALHAWYDKREILVGDSIVGRINEALVSTRFLIVVLSPRSIIKPWVTRELNSTLMRQLDQQNSAILPVLIEDCSLPPLLADLKYADFRHSFDNGLAELVAAIRRKQQ